MVRTGSSDLHQPHDSKQELILILLMQATLHLSRGSHPLKGLICGQP